MKPREDVNTNKILNFFVKYMVYPWIIVAGTIVVGFVITVIAKAP